MEGHCLFVSNSDYWILIKTGFTHLLSIISRALSVCSKMNKSTKIKVWGVTVMIFFTITEMSSFVLRLFHNLMQSLSGRYFTPSSLAAPLCFDPGIVQIGLYFNGASRETWGMYPCPPTFLSLGFVNLFDCRK